MPFQIKFKMATVHHLGLWLAPYCKVLTVPLDVMTYLEYAAQIFLKLCPFKKIQDGGRPPAWIISSTLLQSHYNVFRCADILTKFGICS